MRQAVVLTDPKGFDASRVGKALAALQKKPLTDAMQAARAHWGIVAEALEEAAAQALERALAAEGLSARLLPSAALMALPPVLAVGSVEWQEPGLSLRLRDGRSCTIPASQIELIGSARLEIGHSRTVTVREGPSAAQKIASAGILLATGIPVRLGPKETKVEKKQEETENILILDLGVNGVSGVERYRITGTGLDYSFLKTRKTYNALGNFKSLLSDLQAYAPKAALNRGTRALLSGVSMPDLRYQSVEDLEREIRWLWTIARVK